MRNPRTYYESQLKVYKQQIQKKKKELIIISVLRLIVFVSIILIGYILRDNIFLLPTITIGISVFIILILKHLKIKNKKKILKELININSLELEVLNKNYSNLKKGDEFINANHHYSYDIDLFGEGSLFERINRTGTKKGELALAKVLNSNSIKSIKSKQEALNELANKPNWRQLFTAIAKSTNDKINTENILKYKNQEKYFVPKIFKLLPQIFSCITGILIICYAINIIPMGTIGLWFVAGMGITGIYYSKINNLYKIANNSGKDFNKISALLKQIEDIKFESSMLKKQAEKINTKDKKASTLLKEFSKILDAFDQRNNMLFGFFANGLLLWDLKQSYHIEKWIKNYSNQTENWFETIAYFDAQNSLANYIFNHPKNIFPTIQKNKTIIEAKNLGHPLLKEKNRVDNNLIINKNDFFIVTGANMAGKSTFLRTVSLNIIMANLGLTVCADKFEYSPIKLITSMRTSDSLKDNESYFFSELKRLKFIVDEIKNDEYFIILDEILKGTNSKDKAIGSRKFVEQLVKAKATGIIATHDLSLCAIEDDIEKVENYYFDAEIKNNELYFDYKFKKGVCKNMNASFLLQKMKIIT